MMVTKTIFRKSKLLLDNLKKELTEISEEQENIIRLAERALMKIDEAVRSTKIMVSNHVF